MYGNVIAHLHAREYLARSADGVFQTQKIKRLRPGYEYPYSLLGKKKGRKDVVHNVKVYASVKLSIQASTFAAVILSSGSCEMVAR